jgi:hypothetical protein
MDFYVLNNLVFALFNKIITFSSQINTKHTKSKKVQKKTTITKHNLQR